MVFKYFSLSVLFSDNVHEQIKFLLKEYDAWIFDADFTIWGDRLAKMIGFQRLRDAKLFQKAYGIYKGLVVLLGTPILGEAWGLKKTFDSMAKAKTDYESIFHYAKRGIEKHAFPGVMDFMSHIGKNKKLFLATIGCNVGPKTLIREYEIPITDYTANSVVFEDYMLKGCRITVNKRNKKEKVEDMLREHDFELSDSVVIDDRYYELTKNAGYFISSPYANKKTQGLSDFHISDYRILLDTKSTD